MKEIEKSANKYASSEFKMIVIKITVLDLQFVHGKPSMTSTELTMIFLLLLTSLVSSNDTYP